MSHPTGNVPDTGNPKARLIHPALEAMARSLGLPSLPDSIRKANPDVFDRLTFELISFFILYSNYYEQGSMPCISKIMEEWRDKTGYWIPSRTIYRLIREVFNKQILYKAKRQPSQFALPRRKAIVPGVTKGRINA